MKILIGVLSVLFVLVLGCAQQAPPLNNTTACTADAKICPDGSAVGRVGPNCEFAPCPQIVGNDSDEHGCKGSAGYSWCEARQECVRPWETPCRMDSADAFDIAEAECSGAGAVGMNGTYNENSRTWWFDIEANKTGCSPACVVSENGSAEVNWRCTMPQYTVKTANTSLGEILVDGNGYTLYIFTADSRDNSTCYGQCAVNWPPLLVGDTVSVPKGMAGGFGIIIRTDNTTQLLYNHQPLYYYAGDNAPGDTNGEGVGGKWYVVEPTD